MNGLSPRDILKQLAAALPEECRENFIVVGSVAAGYCYFERDPQRTVFTKDVDCMLSPHLKAVQTGQTVAERLIAAKWKPEPDGPWSKPGDASTPTEDLPLVRLYPPDSGGWNIELLNAPANSVHRERTFTRLQTSLGDFALCSFGFLALAEESPIRTEFGILVARPEMMALANLLHHPKIGPETMSGVIAGRRMKRSNKDLGRVLALAFLAERADEEALGSWPGLWTSALRNRFPVDWQALAQQAGNGIRGLLASEEDMDEAVACTGNGLLASFRVTRSTLSATAQRLLRDAIEPLEATGNT